MSPIGGSMMENAMLFFMYEQARLFLTHRSENNEFTLAHVAQAGAVAGIGTTMVLTPVGINNRDFLCFFVFIANRIFIFLKFNVTNSRAPFFLS